MSDTEEPVKRSVERSSTAKEKAKTALENRSKKSSNAYYYWMVMIVFVGICVACTIYLFHEWQGSPNLVPAVSTENIGKHNAKNALFKRGPNTLFAVLPVPNVEPHAGRREAPAAELCLRGLPRAVLLSHPRGQNHHHPR